MAASTSALVRFVTFWAWAQLPHGTIGYAKKSVAWIRITRSAPGVCEEQRGQAFWGRKFATKLNLKMELGQVGEKQAEIQRSNLVDIVLHLTHFNY